VKETKGRGLWANNPFFLLGLARRGGKGTSGGGALAGVPECGRVAGLGYGRKGKGE
jgi:hypothetical protein